MQALPLYRKDRLRLGGERNLSDDQPELRKGSSTDAIHPCCLWHHSASASNKLNEDPTFWKHSCPSSSGLADLVCSRSSSQSRTDSASKLLSCFQQLGQCPVNRVPPKDVGVFSLLRLQVNSSSPHFSSFPQNSLTLAHFQ